MKRQNITLFIGALQSFTHRNPVLSLVVRIQIFLIFIIICGSSGLLFAVAQTDPFTVGGIFKSTVDCLQVIAYLIRDQNVAVFIRRRTVLFNERTHSIPGGSSVIVVIHHIFHAVPTIAKALQTIGAGSIQLRIRIGIVIRIQLIVAVVGDFIIIHIRLGQACILCGVRVVHIVVQVQLTTVCSCVINFAVFGVAPGHTVCNLLSITGKVHHIQRLLPGIIIQYRVHNMVQIGRILHIVHIVNQFNHVFRAGQCHTIHSPLCGIILCTGKIYQARGILTQIEVLYFSGNTYRFPVMVILQVVFSVAIDYVCVVHNTITISPNVGIHNLRSGTVVIPIFDLADLRTAKCTDRVYIVHFGEIIDVFTVLAELHQPPVVFHIPGAGEFHRCTVQIFQQIVVAIARINKLPLNGRTAEQYPNQHCQQHDHQHNGCNRQPFYRALFRCWHPGRHCRSYSRCCPIRSLTFTGSRSGLYRYSCLFHLCAAIRAERTVLRNFGTAIWTKHDSSSSFSSASPFVTCPSHHTGSQYEYASLQSTKVRIKFIMS